MPYVLNIANDTAKPTPRHAEDSSLIRVRCPHCLQKLRVRSVHTGERVRCPQCRHRVGVPRRAGEWGGSSEWPLASGPRHVRKLAFDPRRFGVWLLIDAAAFITVGWMISRIVF